MAGFFFWSIACELKGHELDDHLRVAIEVTDVIEGNNTVAVTLGSLFEPRRSAVPGRRAPIAVQAACRSRQAKQQRLAARCAPAKIKPETALPQRPQIRCSKIGRYGNARTGGMDALPCNLLFPLPECPRAAKLPQFHGWFGYDSEPSLVRPPRAVALIWQDEELAMPPRHRGDKNMTLRPHNRKLGNNLKLLVLGPYVATPREQFDEFVRLRGQHR